MLQAMLAGVASIKAQQTRMNVIGNNLANVNTTAFKSSRVGFQDMLSQSIRGATRPNGGLGGTNPIQYGLGVLVGGTDTNNEQGSLNTTNRPTDLAIQGNGYFMTSDGSRTAFTRDGTFDLDASGDLVHRTTGEHLLGWDFIAQGNTNTNDPITPAKKLNIPLGRLNAVQATTKATIVGNLSGLTAVGSATTAPDWQTVATFYDSQGGAHKVTLQFFNRQELPGPTDVASWDWRVMDENDNQIAISGTDGPPLIFDTLGKITNAAAARSVTVPADPTGAVMDFSVNLDFSNVTQLKTANASGQPENQVYIDEQDGFPPGSLAGFSIGRDGLITGLFTNGLTRVLGQIATSIFSNPGGLERLGNNLWRQTDNSGIPVTGTPATGGRGAISSGFLEQSNVDIANEFTDLIVTQRGFQANTRVVTTVDEMLQDVLNMKR